MKLKNQIIILLFLILIVGCADKHEISGEDKKEIIDSITYIKDTHGICYASIGSFSRGVNIISITMIPCDKVGL